MIYLLGLAISFLLVLLGISGNNVYTLVVDLS